MLTKSVILENNDPKSEEKYSFEWDYFHPGERIIRFISESMITFGENTYRTLVVFENQLVFVYWNDELKWGYTCVLLIKSKDYEKNCLQFVEAIASLIFDDSDIEIAPKDKKLELKSYNFEIDWIKKSLTGGEIQFKLGRKEEFINQFSHFLFTFRWIPISLTTAIIEDKHIYLHFDEHEVTTPDFIFEKLFLKLADRSNSTFQELLDKSLLYLTGQPKDIDILVEHLKMASEFSDQKTEKEKLELLNTYFEHLYLVNYNYLLDYAHKILISIIDADVDDATVDSLFTLIDRFYSRPNEEIPDLIKLIEGTLLEILVSNENLNYKTHVIKLTEKSKIRGPSHLLAYLDTLVGTLYTSNEELINTILLDVEPQLTASKENIGKLISIYQSISKVPKAIELRLKYIELETNEVSKYFTIIEGIKEILAYENTDLSPFKAAIIQSTVFLILDPPDKSSIKNYFLNILEAFLESEQYSILNDLMEWIILNIQKIQPQYRFGLLDGIVSVIQHPKLYSTLIKVKLLQFDQFLEIHSIEESQSYLENAEKLLKQIFNLVDPNDIKYKERLSIITQSLILSSAKYQEWDLLQEAKHRFSLLIKDKKFYEESILQIFISAGKLRNIQIGTDSTKNEIGLKIFDEVIRMTSKNKEHIKISSSFLPDAKEIALKVKDTRRFLIYTTLELNLKRIKKQEWIDDLKASAIHLLNQNEIEMARKLFETGLEFNLEPIEEYRILKNQLELAEIELDIVNIDEISFKRERMIEIGLQNDGIASIHDILSLYRDGISEILSKGDTKYFHEFLIKSIKFGIENGIDELEDFYTAMNDSFSSILISYDQNHTLKTYNELIYTIRIFQDGNKVFDLSLLVNMIMNIFESNLKIYNGKRNTQFLLRNILLLKEFSHSNLSTMQITNLKENYQLFNSKIKETINLLIKNKELQTSIPLLSDLLDYTLVVDNVSLFESFFDRIVNKIKESLVKQRRPNGIFVLKFMQFEKIHMKIDDSNNTKHKNVFVKKILDLLNVILTFRKQMPQIQFQHYLSLHDTWRQEPKTAFNWMKENLSVVLEYIQ